MKRAMANSSNSGKENGPATGFVGMLEYRAPVSVGWGWLDSSLIRATLVK